MTTLRLFSSCGPCLTNVAGAGPVVRETKNFWITRDGSGKETRVSKSNYKAHIEPCRSCRDHVATQYPNGYMG